MARLPTYQDLGPLPSARTGRPSARIERSVPDTSASARGVANLGKSLTGLGAALGDIQSVNDRAQEFETERRFQEFRWDQAQALDKSMREMEPGQAQGFADSWTTGYNENARAFFESVPDALKPKYDERLFDAEREFYGSAATFGRTEQKRASIAALDAHKNKLALSGDIDRAKKDYDDLLASNPFLTPIEKDENRRKGMEDLEASNIQWRLANGEDIDEIIRDLERAPAPTESGSEPKDDLSFLRRHEGFTAKAKWDYRQYSNGYGTKAAPGEVISEEEAERRLQAEAGAVSQWIDQNITVPLSATQRTALVSFGFNLGTDDLDKLKDDINAGKFDRVATRMLSYNRAGGKVEPGLTKRRREESALFLKGDEPTKVAQAATGTATDAGGAALPSRYQYLSPDKRTQLLSAAKSAQKTRLTERLWDFKQQLADDVESRRQTGVGRLNLELDAIRRTVEPSVWNNYVNQSREADMEFEAGRDLETMPTGQMRGHLDGLVPEPGSPDYEMRAKVYEKIKSRADKIRELRESDPAASVNDLPEVQKASQEYNAQAEEGGADFSKVISARIEAQRRVGIPSYDQSPITKAEAQALLDLPSNTSGLPEREYLSRLRAAADRAEQQYGPLMARKVFESAVRFHIRDKTGSDAAAGIVSKMVKGEAVTQDDYRRMTELQGIDQIGRTFDATVRPDMGDEERPYISPLHAAGEKAFVSEYAAEEAARKPNAAQEQWLRDNPDQWSVFDQKFGSGASARVLGKTSKAKK